jgi:hypothetical protein
MKSNVRFDRYLKMKIETRKCLKKVNIIQIFEQSEENLLK